MELTDEITVRPHGGMQLYVPAEFAGRYGFPLEDGSVRAQYVPHKMLVLFAPDYDPDYPVKIPDPETVSGELDRAAVAAFDTSTSTQTNE